MERRLDQSSPEYAVAQREALELVRSCASKRKQARLFLDLLEGLPPELSEDEAARIAGVIHALAFMVAGLVQQKAAEEGVPFGRVMRAVVRWLDEASKGRKVKRGRNA